MLADRVSSRLARAEKRYSLDTWINDFLLPSQFGYNGHQYNYGLNTTYSRLAVQEISSTLPGHTAAVRGCPPAFAAQMVRALVLSQARFTFRNPPSSRTPRRTFGTQALSVLERPWTNATTGELLSRMEWHAGLAGNAYVTNRTPGRLRVLRPDWVAVVYGSQQEPEMAAHALDGELLGYVYAPGGLVASGTALAPIGGGRMYTLLPEEVAHWSPLPDPECAGIGMSWVTPAVREIQGDIAASQHKLQFFTNGATPNLVVKGIPATTSEQFNELVEMMESRHVGVANAYRTLYLTAGADATVVGANLQQIDFKATVGTGETRISVLSRVPAPVLGISEGLAGSSLNSGNFGMARRLFADTWVYPSLQDVCSALSPLVRVPSDAELWFDTADIPLLRDDSKDLAEIIKEQMLAVESGMRAGFKADAVVKTVQSNDISALLGQHTGLSSVQMQPVGGTPDQTPPRTPPDFTRPARGARRREPDDDDLEDDQEPDEDTAALIAALAYVTGESDEAERAKPFNEALHLRNPKGSVGGGRFRSKFDRIVDALEAWAKGEGPDDPFEGLDREPLRLAAKKRGLTVRRGASRDEIVAQLLDDVRDKVKTKKVAKAAKPKFSYAPQGVDRPQLADRDGKLRDITILGSSSSDTLVVAVVDDKGDRIHDVTLVHGWAELESWADDNGHKDLAGWVRKNHPGEKAKPAPRRRTPAKKGPGKAIKGRDLTRDRTVTSAAFEAGKEDGKWRPSGAGIGSQRGGRYEPDAGGYQAHLVIARRQGFDGLPRVLTPERLGVHQSTDPGAVEWQRLEDEGWIKLYRGWGWGRGERDKPGTEMADEYLYGPLHVGGGLGLGTNMSTDMDAANYYASKDRWTPIPGGALRGFMLPPDARVISYSDAVGRRDAYLATLPAGPEHDAERAVYEDPGTFAMARGFDAMKVTPEDAKIVKGGTEEWVIFNRTALVAWDDNPNGAQEWAKKHGSAPTPRPPTKLAPAKKAAPSVPSSAIPEYTIPPGTDTAAVDALRDRLRLADPAGWLLKQAQTAVSSDYRTPEIDRLVQRLGQPVADRIAREADVENSFARFLQLQRPDDPTLGEYDDLPPVTPKELAEGQVKAAKALRDDLAGKKVAIRMQPDGVVSMVRDGRVKTLFDTGRSGGLGGSTAHYKNLRREREQMLFGIPNDAPASVRPIYGYVAVDGIQPARDSGFLHQYGDVQVVLKDRVRDRTTASVGDSIDDDVLPSPVDNPTWQSFNGGDHMSGGYSLRRDSIWIVEAQIHGGLTNDDIEEVVFSSPPSAALVKQLDDAGVPHRVLSDVPTPPTKRVPAKATPRVRKPAVKRERAALRAAGARLSDAPKGMDNSDPGHPRPIPDLGAALTFANDPRWSERTHKASARALGFYRTSTYKKINPYLRGDEDAESSMQIRERPGEAPTTEYLSTHVALIDQAMAASPLSSPVELWRGVFEPERVFGDAWSEDGDMTGAEWDELGFVSTSADPAVGRMFASGGLMRLHVPAGVGAIQLDSWRKKYPEHNREAELLLQRNLRMRVVGDNEEQFGTYTRWERQPDGSEKMVEHPSIRRVLDVEVEVIPDDEADG